MAAARYKQNRKVDEQHAIKRVVFCLKEFPDARANELGAPTGNLYSSSRRLIRDERFAKASDSTPAPFNTGLHGASAGATCWPCAQARAG